MDAKESAKQMEQAFLKGDIEEGHFEADKILLEIAEQHGHTEAVAIFRKAPKWYA